MSREYRLISADSHLEIDTKNWRHHVPEKHQDRVPHLARTETGADGWVVEGQLRGEDHSTSMREKEYVRARLYGLPSASVLRTRRGLERHSNGFRSKTRTG